MAAYLAVASGGAIGALSRFWLSNSVHTLMGRHFPYGTFVVNVIGSLLIGFLYVWLFDRLNMGPTWRAFLLVGCLGSFTTFSAFSIETVNLMLDGAWLKTLVYVLASVLVCIAMAWLGTILGRHLA